MTTVEEFPAIAGDERMRSWEKIEQPVIPGPPPGLKVTGFRDPYIIQTGGEVHPMLCS